ncbi:OmpA family protein [Chryseolinea sp. T2]|uniref:OmpA family protein n=1 Tax=Chryseolinea sp. T2 TaxID=3129255 RepID=UPI003076B440
MKHIAIFFVFVLLTGTIALGQHSSNAYRDLADSLYRHHHYQHAANYYEKALKKAGNPGYLMLQLGKCYDKVNKPLDAEQWFRMASQKRAKFTDEDYYLYAESLISQQKYERADSLLDHITTVYPEMFMAQIALDDLRHMDRYYADSASYKVQYLPFNTDVAEFSPIRYKTGIVFTSARQEGAMRKKYHWDNSHFLNQYLARKTESGFADIELFEKDLNTKHHDGPAAFYSNYQRMILNRNQRAPVAGREDVFEMYPGLYDAQLDTRKGDWEVTALPFNDPRYSYAHPSISEDGNTLYFASDMPGGYGGMDVYRVTRRDGTWGVPFNLGPVVNSPEDDVFPHFIGNTLYFASNGRGGLGGLDIFKTDQTSNGFAPPANLGYPINSFADDLSLLTDSLQRDGYFASARKGNDDIYTYHKVDPRIRLLAHIYDGETLQPLGGASIQIMTNGSDDLTLVADQQGDFTFDVPKDMSYIIIGAKGDLLGMVADVADSSKTHRIPAYRDTTRLACIGFIKNELGLPQVAEVINIVDQTTGQVIPHPGGQTIISFRGEKGHQYHIEAVHALGHKASHDLNIAKSDQGTKEFTIILNNIPARLPMAARVYKAEDNQPVGNATIRILTFGEDDQELVSKDDGIVDFQLTQGQAYVVIASKDGLSGMHSGMAEISQQKDSVIHQIPVLGDKPNTVLAMGLVINRKGDAVDNFRATVTNSKTGETVKLQASRGLLTFLGDRDGAYDIKVEHDNFETAVAKVEIPSTQTDAHKFSIIMKEKSGQKSNANLIAPLMIAANIPASLLFLDTEDGRSKAFISSNDKVDEIREKNGELTVRQGTNNKSLGKGTIEELRTDPEKVLGRQGLTSVEPVLLRTVYFDFDKHNLDDEDIARLGDVKKVLDNQPSFLITVSGHADDRGKDSYNERLSRRRSNAVAKYLIAQGIDKDRIILKAYGESRPAIPCMGATCTEDDHRLNRRAEFLLAGSGEAPDLNSTPDTRTTSVPKSVQQQNNEQAVEALLKGYGNKSVDGVSFTVNIGAYRKRHDLKFPELSGIGIVESVTKKGTTFYYLTGFKTLDEANNARRQAIAKGIPDATISVYRNGDKIRMDDFAALVH